ncbi:potassium channel family protein [Draconibacterium sp. IB214405]|uniref:potassium channel family protein n=1 Tax=Draconibacterium sp. IB214405 TaxID=3097352 RepID=UPI002A136044|nr:potassium channel family protein [Draconibacterium sp. IB214405]MDX8339047.1 potassium channel family protein [Draconibacterium sp. IB214405]
MINQILIGSVIIVIVSLIHLWATKISIHIIRRSKSGPAIIGRIRNFIWLDSIVLLLILTSLLESIIWAVCYVKLAAFEHFEEAVYFSIVTFTTLGYGDITLDVNWRILASLEAASGIIVFGWSTAIVMGAIQNIILNKKN